MLTFKNIDCAFFDRDTGLDLFRHNPTVIFKIRAPMYWWIDTDWIKYYFNMPLTDFEFCLDETVRNSEVQAELIKMLTNCKTDRQRMQLLPLSAIVTAELSLSYQEIVEVCENYLNGEYNYNKGYGFPNEREWTDFCETLLDIKGVRDLVKEEI